MKKILDTTGTGFMITNTLWSSIGIFILLFRDLNNMNGWQVTLLMLLLNLVLTFSLGELIEHFETLYLKGKLLSSGKYTTDK